MTKEDYKRIALVVVVGTLCIAIAVLALTLANNRFVEACESKGGTVGTTSQGGKTCTGVELK